ncbi:MAG: hypothetical protein DHS20C09_17300 [marine bacterium B5-7]|nr:MAG: hypothetical protein DHS20C09_17300 [marine bacterium B5-7]
MAVFRFFRLPKHQKYDYIPRYWDPRQEELEERLQRIEDIKNGDAEAIKARLSGGFKRGGYQQGNVRFRRSQAKRSNLILLGVLVMLLFLSYMFISVYLPEIAAAIGE